MRLTRIVVRILPEDNHLDTIKRTHIKGTKNIAGGRKTCPSLILLTNKSGKQLKVGFVEFRLQDLLPTIFHSDLHKEQAVPLIHDEHTIAVVAEAVALFNSHIVGVHHLVVAAECRHTQ